MKKTITECVYCGKALPAPVEVDTDIQAEYPVFCAPTPEQLGTVSMCKFLYAADIEERAERRRGK